MWLLISYSCNVLLTKEFILVNISSFANEEPANVHEPFGGCLAQRVERFCEQYGGVQDEIPVESK